MTLVGRSLVVTVATLIASPQFHAMAQTPSLDDLLSRAGQYVARYAEVFSNVVAEEEYAQELVWTGRLVVMSPAGPMAGVPQSVSTPPRPRRRLKSDLVLVKVGPPLEWRPYRDVFEVDGKAVRDRNERLVKLFIESTASPEAQALRIAQESARFNLGSVQRTLNAPGLALAFLQPAIQSRFQFTLGKRDDDAWIVSFAERARPTLFRDNSSKQTNADNPSSGRVWIEPSAGTVTKIEHIVNPEGIKASFTTVFRKDTEYGVAVPVEMLEEISGGPKSNHRITGMASYGRFRRFEVKTETTTSQDRPRD